MYANVAVADADVVLAVLAPPLDVIDAMREAEQIAHGGRERESLALPDFRRSS